MKTHLALRSAEMKMHLALRFAEMIMHLVLRSAELIMHLALFIRRNTAASLQKCLSFHPAHTGWLYHICVNCRPLQPCFFPVNMQYGQAVGLLICHYEVITENLKIARRSAAGFFYAAKCQRSVFLDLIHRNAVVPAVCRKKEASVKPDRRCGALSVIPFRER